MGQGGTPPPNPGSSFQQRLAKTFIENRGQWDSRALYLAKSPGLDYWVTKNGITIDFYGFEKDGTFGGGGGLGEAGAGLRRVGHVVSLNFVGASKLTQPFGYGPAEVTLDFLIGSDPSRHARGVQTFTEAYATSIYPGVHLRNYFDSYKNRFDIVIEPGADPAQVMYDVTGADGIELTRDGELWIYTDLGTIENSRPFAYQPIGNARKVVDARFILLGPNRVGFEIGDYDHRLPLIIDPLVYGTYVGSDATFASTGWETLATSVADENGNLFMTGSTTSITFPITDGPYGFSLNGAQDIFLVRLAGDAYTMSYAAYIGGSGTESALGIGLVNSTGELWIGGTTESSDFPGVSNGTALVNVTDIFLTKFSVDAAGVVTPLFSSYYVAAGPSMEWVDMKVSQSGVVYIAGMADNADLGAFTDFLAFAGGGVDGFVTSLDGSANIGYQKLVGGAEDDTLTGLAVDSDDNVIFVGFFPFTGTEDTGVTSPPTFPTTAGVYENGRFIRNDETFIVKMNSGGSTQFSSLLGGANLEDIADVAVDQLGDIYVTGRTESFDFPRNHGAYDENFSTATKSFATKIKADGAAILYSTGLRTTGNVIPMEIAVDDRGIAIIGGVVGFIHPNPFGIANTIPGSIPIVDGLDGVYDCGDNLVFPPNNPDPNTPSAFPSSVDGFVMFMNAAGSDLLYSDYIGECGDEIVNDIIVDVVGATWLVGDTTVVYNADGQQQLPTGLGPYITNNAFKRNVGANQDGWAIKLRVGLPILDSISLDPNEMAGGLGVTSTVTVNLRDPAPPGGVTLTATLSNPAATSFDVDPGSTTLIFTIAVDTTTTTLTVFSLPVTSQSISDVRVTLDNDFVEDRLTIKPWLDDFSISPSEIVGGNQLTARVTLFQVAMDAVTVQLTTDRPDLVTLPVPAQLTVPAGAQTSSILLETSGVTTAQNLTITGSLLGVGKDAFASLTPATVQILSFLPTRVNGGEDTVATVRLSGKSGINRTIDITYVSGATGALVEGNALPQTVVIPAQESEVNFAVTAPFVPSPSAVTLNASDTVTSVDGTLFIDDIDIAQLVVSPATDVIGGTVLTVVVRLTRAAGAGGFTVDLDNSNPAAGTLSVSTITIEPGELISPEFMFTTEVVSADEVTTLSVSKLGFTTQTETVTVRTLVIDLTLDPIVVVGGVDNSVGTVTFAPAAPPTGLTLTLSSTRPEAATVPATVDVPGGATTFDFDVTTLKVQSDQGVVIRAEASPAVFASATMTVKTPGIVSLVIDPSTVTGPTPATGTVTLAITAPEGGLDVLLAAVPGSAAAVPTLVNVPEGSDTASFTITTFAVSFDSVETITATLESSVINATLTVRAPVISGITFAPPRVLGGNNAIGTVTLDQPAPVGGLTIEIMSHNLLLAVIVGADQFGVLTVTIPEGQSSANFTVITVPVSRMIAVRFTAGPPASPMFSSGYLYIKP
ncbi:MAG: SBBP repeat-containing protein [Armatimonadetes bacterium]|nr:SBBP repeat-containing protein [Armatimonadota bacterium]